MPCSRTRLPERFADWLAVKIPEIDVRRITLCYCDRLPFEWVLAGSMRPSGITLWRSIYLRDRLRPFDPCDRRKVELLMHELIHVRQFHAHPLWFPLTYLRDLAMLGYQNNPAEIEARAHGSALAQDYARENPYRCSRLSRP